MVKYLNPAKILKTDKEFAKRLDFKQIKFPAKIRDTKKIEKKNSIGINVFGYENKEKYPIYISKQCCKEKHVDLLLIGEERDFMFLSKFLILSCMTLLYFMEENIFVVVYKLLVQTKY